LRAPASLKPVTRQLATGLVINADNTRLVFADIPNDLAEFRLIVVVTAVAGTNPTLDAIHQDSPDEGQTWLYTGNKFAQMVGVDQRQISVSRERHAAQAAAESSAANPAIGAAAAAVNGPLTRKQALFFRLGGTVGPSFTVSVFLIGNVPAS
jgi:hypothetical protein